MPTLPMEIMNLQAPFVPPFSARTWTYVPALLVGSILTLKRRQVSTALRALGLAQVPWFQNFHRVLNRAPWSPLAASRVLLGLLSAAFAPEGPCWWPWTIPWSDAAGRTSPPRASTATPCAPVRVTSSKRAGCAGCAHPLGRARLGAALPDGAGAF